MQRARTDRPFVRVSAVVTAIGAMLMSLPPQAVQAQTTAAAPAAAVRDFDIAAGSLASALIRFGEQAGVQFTVPASLTAGKQAPALKGRYTAEGGLRELLSGSGLAFRFANPQTVVIEAAPQGDRVLGPVRIEGVQAAAGAGGGTGTGWGVGPNGSSDVTATEGTKSLAASAVTLGGKSPSALKDVPQTVSVVTRKQIEDQNLVSITDVMNQTPGISVVASTNPSDASFFSRGYAITSVQLDGGAPLTAGGGGLNSYSQRGDLAAVYDHVEVLRGADGIFDGMGQPSGTINLVRKKPLAQYQFTVDASVGSWQNYRTALDVTGPLAFDGKLRGRLVGAVQDQKYFYDNAKSGTRTLYGILEFDASSSTLLTLGAQVGYNPSKPFTVGLSMSSVDGSSLNLPRNTSFVPDWNRNNMQSHQLFAGIEQRFGADWSAKLNLTRADQTSDFLYASPQGSVDPSTGDGAFMSGTAAHWINKQTLIDLTVNGKFDALGRKHEVTLGYSSSKLDYAGSTTYRPTPDFFPFNYYTFDPTTTYPEPIVDAIRFTNPVAQITQTGAYAKVKLHLTDRLHFGTGLRWSEYKADSTTSVGGGLFEFSSSSSSTHSSIAFAALAYDVSKLLSAYASYADIYEDQSYLVDASGERMKPITGKSFELGAKFQSEDKKLNASAALFWAKRNNIGVYVSDPDPSMFVPPGTGCCYLDAGGTETSKGIDLSVSGEVLPRLQLTGGYTLNITKNKDYSDPTNPTVAPLRSYVPKHLFKLWGDYKLAGDGWRNRLTIGGGVNAQTKTYGGYSPAIVRQGAYAVAGVRAAYDITSKWRLALNIDNLFDRTYYQTIGDAGAYNWYGTPRSFMLSLHGQFN